MVNLLDYPFITSALVFVVLLVSVRIGVLSQVAVEIEGGRA